MIMFMPPEVFLSNTNPEVVTVRHQPIPFHEGILQRPYEPRNRNTLAVPEVHYRPCSRDGRVLHPNGIMIRCVACTTCALRLPSLPFSREPSM
jgi:hypothetical protein